MIRPQARTALRAATLSVTLRAALGLAPFLAASLPVMAEGTFATSATGAGTGTGSKDTGSKDTGAAGDAYTVTPDPGEAARVAQMAFVRALTLAQRGEWVFAMAEGTAAGPVARDVIDWQRLRSGSGSFADYKAFAQRHPDWPGMDLLRRAAEATLDGQPPGAVIDWFAHTRPQTADGLLALVAALDSENRGAEADHVAAAGWRTMRFSAADQAAVRLAIGSRIAGLDNARMEAMLDQGATDQATRLLDTVSPDMRALAQARIALQRRSPGVDALVTAVPASFAQAPGLAYDRALWRWRVGQEDGAAEIVLARSDSPQNLGTPAHWATLRSQLARFYLRKGDAQTAYKIAARHRMVPGGEAWADLEWLAGYAALQLGDGPVALSHFDALAAAVKSPISLARAGYWQGEALEHLGRISDARTAWARAARWQTAYYGLLAAEKLGQPLDPEFSFPASLPPWQEADFTRGSLFAAAQMLRAAGSEDLARRFLLQEQETLPETQIAPMARLAQDWGDAKLVLTLGKRAAETGDILIPAYYPLPQDLATGNLAVPEDLALSIARRESEFDPQAVSQVGALGLMQLMPATAELVAPAAGESFDKARLTADPAYNLRLGSSYLARLRSEFGTSPVLTAVGYNAGPARARAWIADMGDPRLEDTDIVGWVEMIPYAETRNYVMRVAESLPVYRARLGGDIAGPLDFTAELRGSPPPPETTPEMPQTPPAANPAEGGTGAPDQLAPSPTATTP